MSEWIFAQTQGWWQEFLGQSGQPQIAGFDKDAAEAAIPRSDLVAARFIANKFARTLTYVDKQEQWHIWDGLVHRPLESPAIVKQLLGIFADELTNALAFVEQVYETEAQAIIAGGGANAQRDAQRHRDQYNKFVFGPHRSYRDRVYSTGGVNALLAALQVEVTVTSDYYNDDRQWLVVRNGVIDLFKLRETRQWPTLLDHSPDRPVTRYFDADYDPQGAYPTHWYTFLERSLPDAETRRFLTKVTGAAFMAAPKLKIIPNLSGPPNSGKSLFIETMHKLGGGYSAMPQPQALLKVQGTNFEQDALRNKRFVGVSEPDEQAKLDDGFVKRVSGGDWTETRTLHSKASGWYPQCVMYVASNHAVRFNTRDGALLERVALINFPNQFLDNAEAPVEIRMDKFLGEKLLDEGTGILNWLIYGMLWFMEESIEPTQQIIDNRQIIQYSGSTALQWIKDMQDDEYIEVVDEAFASQIPGRQLVSLSEAYSHYQIWCAQVGERYPLSRTFFSRDIQTRYGELRRVDGWRLSRIIWTDKWYSRHNSPQQVGADGTRSF